MIPYIIVDEFQAFGETCCFHFHSQRYYGEDTVTLYVHCSNLPETDSASSPSPVYLSDLLPCNLHAEPRHVLNILAPTLKMDVTCFFEMLYA
jgi:hypothetical protein